MYDCTIVMYNQGKYFAAFNSIDLPYGLGRETLLSVAKYAGVLLDEFAARKLDNNGMVTQSSTFINNIIEIGYEKHFKTQTVNRKQYFCN